MNKKIWSILALTVATLSAPATASDTQVGDVGAVLGPTVVCSTRAEYEGFDALLLSMSDTSKHNRALAAIRYVSKTNCHLITRDELFPSCKVLKVFNGGRSLQLRCTGESHKPLTIWGDASAFDIDSDL